MTGQALSVVTLLSFFVFVLFLLRVGISYRVPVLVPAGYVEVIWGLSGGGDRLYVGSQFVVMFRQIYCMNEISILGSIVHECGLFIVNRVYTNFDQG